MTTFSSLGLANEVQASLAVQGYTTPTPIQEQAIPIVMQGHDLLGIAQTGTGKTAAFALPILHHIFSNRKKAPAKSARCLVLAPTRELASQIAVSFRGYATTVDDFYVAAIFGGVKVTRQIPKLVKGNDVLVATPGRLLDLIDQKALHLSDIEILVLDEADQMMDMGFIHALRQIIPLIPKERQTLFFSATMPPKITRLAKQFLNNPKKVSVTPANTIAERVSQTVTFVNQKEKQSLLSIALQDPDIDRALVFTRTKHGADRVVKNLARVGIAAEAIHGNKSQGQRQRILKGFRAGETRILVATDIAARGIDIDGISHVFNFEIPNVAEQYVHRIGRTARAGREGRAIAYVAPDEKAYLKDIQKLLKMTIPVDSLPDNFLGKVKELSKRDPLPPKPKSEDQKRSKRGKNRKRKAKPAHGGAGRKHRSEGERKDKNSAKSSTHNPPRKHDEKDLHRQSKPSRHTRRKAGQEGGKTQERHAAQNDPQKNTKVEFKRKPRKGGGFQPNSDVSGRNTKGQRRNKTKRHVSNKGKGPRQKPGKSREKGRCG